MKRPKINKIENINFSNPNHNKLDNGINLYTFGGATQEIVKIDFVFKAGNWEEDKHLQASLTGNMLNEGTKKMSAKVLMEEFNFYGVDVDVEVDVDCATVCIEVLTKHLDKVLPLVKDILTEATFPEEEFKTIVKTIKNKITVNEEKNSYLAKEAFLKTLYGEENPYGKIATKENLLKLTTDDLKRFYKKYYVANNCTIIASGNISKDFEKIINKYFGGTDWINNEFKFTEKGFKPVSTTSNSKFIEVQGKGKLQTALAIGHKSIQKTHVDYKKLQLLNYILGGGSLGSRLMDNIREKRGYTYGIYGGSKSYLQTGFFRILTEVGTEYKDDTLKQIEIEINKLKEELVTPEELDLAKNSLLGELLNLADGPFSKSTAFKNVMLYELDMTYYKKFEEEINKATAEELKELANKYYNFDDMYKIVVSFSE